MRKARIEGHKGAIEGHKGSIGAHNKAVKGRKMAQETRMPAPPALNYFAWKAFHNPEAGMFPEAGISINSSNLGTERHFEAARSVAARIGRAGRG